MQNGSSGIAGHSTQNASFSSLIEEFIQVDPISADLLFFFERYLKVGLRLAEETA
jgi:hypothetical protein